MALEAPLEWYRNPPKKRNQPSFHSHKICEAGRYAATSGQPSCTYCPTGRYLVDNATNASLHDALDDCVACPVGEYLTATGLGRTVASNCSVCQAGKYSDEVGQPSCVQQTGFAFNVKRASF